MIVFVQVVLTGKFEMAFFGLLQFGVRLLEHGFLWKFFYGEVGCVVFRWFFLWLMKKRYIISQFTFLFYDHECFLRVIRSRGFYVDDFLIHTFLN